MRLKGLNDMTTHFCTCKDINCPIHPLKLGKGCDPCIQKNLMQGEIPSCFFRAVSDNLDGLEEYTFESFVRFYLRNRGKQLA